MPRRSTTFRVNWTQCVFPQAQCKSPRIRERVPSSQFIWKIIKISRGFLFLALETSLLICAQRFFVYESWIAQFHPRAFLSRSENHPASLSSQDYFAASNIFYIYIDFTYQGLNFNWPWQAVTSPLIYAWNIALRVLVRMKKCAKTWSLKDWLSAGSART